MGLGLLRLAVMLALIFVSKAEKASITTEFMLDSVDTQEMRIVPNRCRWFYGPSIGCLESSLCGEFGPHLVCGVIKSVPKL